AGRVLTRCDMRDRRRRAGDVAGERADRRQRLEPLAVLDDDERPALLVLGAVGAAAGVEDLVEVGLRERAAVEGPDRALGVDRLADVHPGIGAAGSGSADEG